MRTTGVALVVFCFSIHLFGQSCITFAGPEVATLFSGATITGLLRQPDGSYTAVTGPTSPPYMIESLTTNYQNYIGGCTAPPVTMGMPGVTVAPPPAGTASQVVAFGYFVTGSSIPGAAYTATPSAQPYVAVGVVNSHSVNLTKYPVPEGAETVATADFNNDGNADLAVIHDGGVAILLGNGDGTFQAAVSYPLQGGPLGAAIADLNGDGRLDIAVAAFNGITILLGNGDGTFRTGASITAGLASIESVTAADFNGDGKPDLGVASFYGVSILLGNGDGTFKAPQNVPAGGESDYLAAADFNKDGKLDLAVANSNADMLTVLLGKGDGTFGAPTQYNIGYSPNSIIITDFNHDGNLDLVVGSGTPGIITGNFADGGISVLLGNGDGTFRGSTPYTVPGLPYWIATADLNGDGKPDLVTANQSYGFQSPGGLSILLNQGNGKFAAAAPYLLTAPDGSQLGATSVALTDLNGDGKVDMAVTNSSGGLSVSLGNGDGTFKAPTLTTASGASMVAVGDLNGDGKPDLVTVGGTNTSGTVSILLGSGGGAFQAATNISVGVGARVGVLQDLNGDGKLDLVVLEFGVPPGFPGVAPNAGGVSVLLGKGDGSFQPAVAFAAGTNPTALAVGDVNGDGRPDLAVATNDSNFVNGLAYVFLGNGDGTFKNPASYPGQFLASDIAIADMNGDGKPDILIASCCGDTQMSYLLGNGDGTFLPEVYFNGGPSPYFIAVADYNGDGKPDLAIADQPGTAGNSAIGYVTVLLNTTKMAAFITKSAAAGQVVPFAADSIVAAYGANLAAGTEAAPSLPLGTTLDGTTVTVTDSAGVSRPAPLFYVSPTQVNYEIPDGTAPGTATVTITSKNGTTQTATIQVGTVSPGLFELNASGLVAALVLPVVNGTNQNPQPVYQLNSSNAAVPLPINVAAANSQFYLEMYGTGIRNAKNVTVTVGGANVPVLFHGSAPGYAGEDQVNIGPLPFSLAGKGNVNIVLRADGQAANTVNVTIQ